MYTSAFFIKSMFTSDFYVRKFFTVKLYGPETYLSSYEKRTVIEYFYPVTKEIHMLYSISDTAITPGVIVRSRLFSDFGFFEVFYACLQTLGTFCSHWQPSLRFSYNLSQFCNLIESISSSADSLCVWTHQILLRNSRFWQKFSRKADSVFFWSSN